MTDTPYFVIDDLTIGYHKVPVIRDISVKVQKGEIIALINYMNQILVSLLRLADLVISVTRALASGMRVNEILNTHTTMPDPAAAEQHRCHFAQPARHNPGNQRFGWQV